MSPVAKIRSWPSTRRSGPTISRPPLPCGRPHLPASGGPATPAAQAVRLLGISCPLSRMIRSAVISLILAFRCRSTPRLTSCWRAYSRSGGTYGASRYGAISTSRICTHCGSMSGYEAGRPMLRSSARVPASSTPVAPPPTIVTVTSRAPSRLSCSRPARMRSRIVTASCRVYRAWLYSAAPVIAVEAGRHPGGQDEVVVLQLPAVGESATRAAVSRLARSPCLNRAPYLRAKPRSG